MLPTASAAKILVLLSFAARAEHAGDLDTLLDRRDVDPVADSGLWQHLRVDRLPADDVARLIGALSDNLATNVLIAHLGGVEQIMADATACGIHDPTLHDIVRDRREPSHPVTLSTGSARGYATLMRRIARHDDLPTNACDRVLDWLADGADLSMAASAFCLDPLARREPGAAVRLVNKTGTDRGVAVDVGIVTGPARSLAYAFIGHTEIAETAVRIGTAPSTADTASRPAMLAEMRRLGAELARSATGSTGSAAASTASGGDSLKIHTSSAVPGDMRSRIRDNFR